MKYWVRVVQDGIIGMVFAVIHMQRELGLCFFELEKMDRFMVPDGFAA